MPNAIIIYKISVETVFTRILLGEVSKLPLIKRAISNPMQFQYQRKKKGRCL